LQNEGSLPEKINVLTFTDMYSGSSL